MIKRIGLFLLMIGVAAAGTANAAPKKDKGKKKKDKTTETAPPPGGDQPVEIEVSPDQQTPAGGGAPAGGGPGAPAAPAGQEGAIEITPESQPAEGPEVGGGLELKVGQAEVSWSDIVVVVRKDFLKQNRLELIPAWGITLNDNMIQHIMFQGQANYWLTDVLAVGAEAQIFAHTFREPYDLVARDYRRLPTLNQYNFGGALNFHYVPMYGKFAIVNKYIVHWEGMFTAGVGFTQSQIIPRDPAFPSWTNFLITPNVGVTFRVFLSQWLTLDLGVKDYIFIDKFENVNRTMANVDDAMANATSQLINNIMFSAGLSFWIPPVFHYTTFR